LGAGGFAAKSGPPRGTTSAKSQTDLPVGLAHIVGWVERSETHHKPMMGFTEPAIGLRSARTRWFNPSYRQPRVALGSRV